MNGDLIVIIFIAVVTILLVVIETHVAFVILALCSGYVLREFAANQTYDLLAGVVSPTEFPLYEVVHVTLTLLPAILIAHRFRRTQRGVSRFVQQLVPALALTLLLVVFLIDILPDDVSNKVRDNAYLAGVFDSFAWVVIVFAISTAMFDVLVKHAGDGSSKKRGPGRPPKR
jgi:hypothetical protein